MAGAVSVALYRGLTGIFSPAVPALLYRRALTGKEDGARLAERRGIASLPRPIGTLIWIHAASVGESLAILPLVSRLVEKPGCSVLVTTGTVTSAELMRQRLPSRAFHQFAPVDLRAGVGRFLEHWRPDVALFVESEIWPNLLLETQRRKVPIALINARLTRRSFERWKHASGLARRVFSVFDICLAQDDSVAERLRALGARDVRIAGNLKADAPPLPVDEAELSQFRQAIGARPVFLAASTHVGEEQIILDAAVAGTLTIIVPRHADRGAEIEILAQASGFTAMRRRNCSTPSPEIGVYIADTMGELGLFYRVARVAFLGGSLIPHGGQNPLEAACLGVPVLAGPQTANFDDAYRILFAAQEIGRINTADELKQLATRLLDNPEEAARIGRLAQTAAETMGGALGATVQAAEQLLANARA